MGAFYEHVTCEVCGRPTKLSKLQHKAWGKWICPKCFSECCRHGNIKNMSISELQYIIKKRDENQTAVESFVPTKDLGVLKIDERTKTWMVQKRNAVVHKYSDIASAELLEDGQTISTGGLGMAAAGGLLFGGAGAIVGATRGKSSKTKCSRLEIKITLKTLEQPTETIVFIGGGAEFNKTGLIYRTDFKTAQECMSALQIMQADAENVSDNASSTMMCGSPAEEIAKYKNLLDIGAITEEEYNLKKAQLLQLL